MKFNIYHNGIKNTTPNGEITLKEFLEMIKTDTPLFKEIRKYADNKDEKNKLKKKLSYVTFAGTFTTRAKSNLIKSSGYACFDIDDTQNLEEAKQKIISNKYTHCCFVSPSGNGLKFLVKIPEVKSDEEYKQYWLSIQKHYNLPDSDEATKDISRACYLSYDSKPYFNSDSEVYVDKFSDSNHLETKTKEKDTSRSGLEFRKAISLFRKGKTRKEVETELMAYKKFADAPEQYQEITLDKAESFVLEEEEKTKQEPQKTIQPTKEHFFRTKKIIQKYVDTSELNYNFLTTWTLGTHFHNKFETYPLLILMARKQSGKTRTLKLISSLSHGSDGSISTSVTETYLFRHKVGALFFDEMESISSREKTALRETINAVYKRGNKIVRYTEKKNEGKKEYVEEHFFPFYPLGLANIYGFGDVLTDRGLQIILQRSNKKQTQLIEDFSTNQNILLLKEELSKIDVQIPEKIFSEWNSFIQNKKYDKKLRIFFEAIKETKLIGRPLEIFFPLFIVGKQFGVLDLLIESAKNYIEQLEGDSLDNPDDLLQTFMDNTTYSGFVSLSQLLRDFKNDLEEPEDWMNSKWFGRALKRLGLVQKKRMINGRVQVLLKDNTTNTPNTTISTNTTNSTKDVELVEFGRVYRDSIDKTDNEKIDEILEDSEHE